jgi:hypothetical protein
MPRKRTLRAAWNIVDAKAEERASRRAELVRAYGQWIEKYSWNHFVSFTARWGTSSLNLLSRFESFVHAIEREASGTVPWLAVVEKGRSPDPHVHGFINRTSELRTEDIAKHWRWGNTRVLIYNPLLRGAFYVAKAIGHEGDLEWGISDRLDRVIQGQSSPGEQTFTTLDEDARR